MAIVGDLLNAESREALRTAITDEAWALGERLGLTGEEKSIIATRMMVTVEQTELQSSG